MPYEQVRFHRDRFPWRKDGNSEWPMLEIAETTDELTSLEPGEIACRPETGPFVMNEVRTRSQAAAAQAKKAEQPTPETITTTNDASDKQPTVSVEEESRKSRPQVIESNTEAEKSALEQLQKTGGSVFLDEEGTYVIFCGRGKSTYRLSTQTLAVGKRQCPGMTGSSGLRRRARSDRT